MLSKVTRHADAADLSHKMVIVSSLYFRWPSSNHATFQGSKINRFGLTATQGLSWAMGQELQQILFTSQNIDIHVNTHERKHEPAMQSL